ncbi:AAA family ATPase [Vibrio splendidus]|uniref:AAA family ATPase n=1 Tax=Vibrio splendidus TaxID=29497 RepID=UPI00130002E0|nr:AAA family ATPase [Vibrio splendidus]
MALELVGVNDVNGFKLSDNVVIENDLIILTGQNGSGKTRLLSSIHGAHTQVKVDGKLIEVDKIQLVNNAALKPNFSGGYQDAAYNAKRTSTLAFYDQHKHIFDLPFDANKARQFDHIGRNDGALNYAQLYTMVKGISTSLNKPASQLTSSEFKLHFEDPIGTILGFQSLSTICNQYIYKKEENEINEYRVTVKGRKEFTYYSDEVFENNFGKKPWLVINQILDDTFNGKFRFSEPDETSQTYTYQAQLFEKDNPKPLAANALSSGEETLLWLALTLFNSQYYTKEQVKVPELLLLDEPDAFLHPKMVEKMYAVLDSVNREFNTKIFLTTHSPTTVALAPTESIYVVSPCNITRTSKDQGISELLDGITQVSIDPNNRRQVYVESHYDANIFTSLYRALLPKSTLIDSSISLSFVSSGDKTPSELIRQKLSQILNINNPDLVEEFVQSINGVGCCSKVYGQVESLVNSGNSTVRGIVDWDLSNQSNEHVSVLASNYAYAIENLAFDPVAVLILLHLDCDDHFTMSDICGEDVYWQDWLDDQHLVQTSIDRYLNKVLKSDNAQDINFNYFSGCTYLGDKRYFELKGHNLESKILAAYPQLKRFRKQNKDGAIKEAVVTKGMIKLTRGKFIPKAFEEVLAAVQK